MNKADDDTLLLEQVADEVARVAWEYYVNGKGSSKANIQLAIRLGVKDALTRSNLVLPLKRK